MTELPKRSADVQSSSGSDIPRLNELSSEEKRTLLARLIRERNVEPKRFPLSYAQERLWFLDRLSPGNPCYNSSIAIHIEQPLDLEVLRRALNEVVRRHSALRTNFKEINGEPVQLVAPQLTLSLPVIEVPDLPGPQLQDEVLRLATEEARRPYDLATDPLVRVTLLRLNETHHVFLLGMHHIISDGWSMTVFSRELTALCATFSLGQPSPLPELRVQYTDFAVWQRNWLQGDVLQSQLAYWTKQLADAPVLQLPADYPRPALPSFRGATHEFLLPAPLITALEALSRDEGVTMFMTLLAAFKTLLYRYTGQDDIVVGAPIANRERTEIEGLIGFFVNMLAIRTDLSGDPSFRGALQRVREVTLDAFAHQSMPFEKLVEELQPERDVSRNPVFQVTFQLFNAPDSVAGAAISAPRQVPVETGTAVFDIAFDAYKSYEGIVGRFQYSTDLFDQSTIARMGQHFGVLLDSIVAYPDRHISNLEMLTASERMTVLTQWNRTEADYPRDTCVHHQFEAQAALNPGHLALAFGERQLTYAELNDRGDRLAAHLRNCGVGPGSLAAVLAERCPELVIAVLGILKAGAAYVPLDPSYPRERLAFMLEDSKSAVLLSDERLLDRVSGVGLQVICRGGEWQTNERAVDHPIPLVDPESLAYVIYTSGSTGRPRGVETRHRGLVNLSTWHQRAYNVTPEDRATLIASPAFDASVWEMWPYLTAGASVHIPDEPTRAEPSRLARWIVDNRITLSFMPTPLAEHILEEPWPADVALRALLTGGDKLRSRPVNDIPFRLFNHYGPTESTVVTTWCEVDAGDKHSDPPIGLPISNTSAYVLDRHLNPMPVGLPGELYISGEGLARGYLNRPELNAQSFLLSPFNASARLYKTGDLVRRRADGNLEFLRRLDDQVKLRGFRIETREIESALNEHPAVQETVVLAHQDRLVAYVVPSRTSRPSPARYMAGWQTLFDQTVAHSPSELDPTFNITGWNSSYTGLPIPDEQMKEQVERTAERILQLRPQRVLEMGCGTGLLLFRISPFCREYLAADFSRVSLDHIEKQLRESPLPQVRLRQATAEDFDSLRGGRSYDAVILNSVLQYFPDLDYLMGVMEQAVRAVSPGGHIFIGDVRSLPLLESFHGSIELSRASDLMPISELRERIQRRIAQEEELVIDPEFFSALPRHLPQVGQVRLLAKRGRHHNELTRFRYDVILRVNNEVVDNVRPADLDWVSIGSIAALRRMLRENQAEAISITGIPDARTNESVGALSLLAELKSSSTVRDLRAQMVSQAELGVDPEDIWAMAEESSYYADIGWQATDATGRYDAFLYRREQAGAPAVNGLSAKRPETVQPWSSYANDPLTAVSAETLSVTLRGFLKERLPEHMIPSAFVPLKALPINASGKVDRRLLPAPEAFGMHAGRIGAAPRTEVEKALAVIWRDLLGLDSVNVDDNFFEAGGHSLLLIRLQTRVNEAFAADLSMMDLFRCPTIGLLAELLIPGHAVSAVTPTATADRAEKQREAIARRRQHSDNQDR